MTGTFVNAGAIFVGSLAGLAAGKHLPERLKTTVMQALGLAVILIGLQMALSGKEYLTSIGCLLLGALTGELLRIEQGVERIGEWLKSKTGSSSSTFVQGFVSASVLYLTGAMMIVGAIQDGTVGDTRTLYIKSLLDGVASIALSSTLGAGRSLLSLIGSTGPGRGHSARLAPPFFTRAGCVECGGRNGRPHHLGDRHQPDEYGQDPDRQFSPGPFLRHCLGRPVHQIKYSLPSGLVYADTHPSNSIPYLVHNNTIDTCQTLRYNFT